MMAAMASDNIINWSVLGRRAQKGWKVFIWLTKVFTVAAAILVLNKYFITNDDVNNTTIIAYLEALKWPILILVIFTLFRKHIPDLVNRLIELGKDGAKFSPPQQLVSVTDIDELSDLSASNKLSKKPTYDLSKPGDRLRVLDEVDVKYALERVYRNIFGTQLEALNLLDATPQGVPVTSFTSLLNKHKSLLGNLAFKDLEGFMRYLDSYNLIKFDADTNTYRITDLGLLFLDYLDLEKIRQFTKPF